VLEGQFAKVRYLLDRAARHSDLVCSHSRYAESARRTAGVATHDSNDVRASIAGFHRYWADLDQGEARIFLARASIEFPVNSMTGAGPYRKLWVAALGAPEDLSGGGDTAAQEDTSTPLEGWIRAEVLPLIRGALSGTSQGPSWETSGEIEDLDLVGTSDPDEGGLEQAHHGYAELGCSLGAIWERIGRQRASWLSQFSLRVLRHPPRTGRWPASVRDYGPGLSPASGGAQGSCPTSHAARA
jgi:hypothetical protein